MITEDTKYWVALHQTPGLGPRRFALLESFFGSMEAVWRSDMQGLMHARLNSRIARSIVERRSEIDPDDLMDKLDRLAIIPLSLRSPHYPEALRDIHSPPSVLYTKGRLDLDETRTVSIVGTRRATQYGKSAVRMIAGDIAAAGVAVVSGLARGIDSEAHRAALDRGGKTVAVLPCGLEKVYPAHNQALADDILGSGSLVSEYPPGVRERAEHFPMRNRLISGISRFVIIGEGSMNSGAKITAEFAFKEGRDVLAIPGSITSAQSILPNWLIQQGAKLISHAQDVLDELNLMAVISKNSDLLPNVPIFETVAENASYLEGEQNPVLDILSKADEPMHIDDLTRESGMDASVVSASLTIMELKGEIRQAAPMLFELGRTRFSSS